MHLTWSVMVVERLYRLNYAQPVITGSTATYPMPAHDYKEICSVCQGKGTKAICSHREETEHTYCEHDGNYFMSQHD